MKQRILNMIVVLDSLIYVWATLVKGHPGETISSAAWRAELHGMWFGRARPVIDWALCWLEDDHCQGAWLYAVNKRNLPEDMR